jgi:hypothetical protein
MDVEILWRSPIASPPWKLPTIFLPGETAYFHNGIPFWIRQYSPRQGPQPSAWVLENCTTERPADVCSCGRFALVWRGC